MAELVSQTTSLASGGGAYTLPSLTMGVFLSDQPTHRIALGGDRLRPVPLERHQGWILPAVQKVTVISMRP